jgi:hypothetical protein
VIQVMHEAIFMTKTVASWKKITMSKGKADLDLDQLIGGAI